MRLDERELAGNISPDVRAANPAVFGLPVPGITPPEPWPRAGKIPQPPAPGKYHAIKTEHNGIVYHSKKEAAKAQELDILVKSRNITFYLRQVPFTLSGGIVYRADFVTFKAEWIAGPPSDRTHIWKIKVIEVKGFKTPEWKMKLKLFRATYPSLDLEVC